MRTAILAAAFIVASAIKPSVTYDGTTVTLLILFFGSMDIFDFIRGKN